MMSESILEKEWMEARMGFQKYLLHLLSILSLKRSHFLHIIIR